MSNIKLVHRLVITVAFDKPCSPAWALEAAKDNIHGDFWPLQPSESHPGKMTVRGFRHAPKQGGSK